MGETRCIELHDSFKNIFSNYKNATLKDGIMPILITRI